MVEIKKQNIIFSKDNRPKMNLSVKWLREMGITEIDKTVKVSFDGMNIIIEKIK